MPKLIPSKFDYVTVDSAEAAIAALTEHGDESKLMAGGHSLIPLMKFRLANPTVVIDIGRVKDLSYINDGGDHIAIGALTNHMAVETSDLLKANVPLLAHCASQVGDPSVRHRGTIGGSLAHADAASDLPAAMLALKGSVVVKGPGGERVVAADDLFTGFLENSLADDEMITEVRVPKMNGAGWSYQKFNRRAQDWAIVGVAAVLNGSAGIGLVNMGSTPLRASGVEDAIASGASHSDAAQKAADGGTPPEDLNADAEYRTHLAKVLVERALIEAAGRKG